MLSTLLRERFPTVNAPARLRVISLVAMVTALKLSSLDLCRFVNETSNNTEANINRFMVMK